MILEILATLVLAAWVLQGAHLTMMTLGGGYHPFWAGLVALATAALVIPAIAVWA